MSTELLDTVRTMANRLKDIENTRDGLTDLHQSTVNALNDYRLSIIKEQRLLEGRWELRSWDHAPVLVALYDEAYPRLLEIMPPFLPWGSHSVLFDIDDYGVMLEVAEKGHRLQFRWDCTPQEIHDFCIRHHITVVLTDECRAELIEQIGNFQRKVDDMSFVLNEL